MVFAALGGKKSPNVCICMNHSFLLHTPNRVDCVCMQVWLLHTGICISACMHSAQDHCQPIIEEICMQGVSLLPL